MSAAIAIKEENRFSIHVKSRKSAEYQALLSWQNWFSKRGIPCVIEDNGSGHALYREGLIEVDIHDESGQSVISAGP